MKELVVSEKNKTERNQEQELDQPDGVFFWQALIQTSERERQISGSRLMNTRPGEGLDCYGLGEFSCSWFVDLLELRTIFIHMVEERVCNLFEGRV